MVRLETDSDGVYEAHLVRADGTPVTVLVDEDFEVTGQEEGGAGHHFGNRDDTDDDTAEDSSTT